MTLTPGALTRRNAVGSVALDVGASAWRRTAAVVAAADLITGKDIKDGTVKKTDLAPKVRKQLNAPGPRARKGHRVSRACRAQGTPGVPGTPGSDAPADGPALVMGRIADPGGVCQCLIAPAIGLSETLSATTPESTRGDADAANLGDRELHRDANDDLGRGRFAMFQTNSGDTYCTIAAGTTAAPLRLCWSRAASSCT